MSAADIRTQNGWSKTAMAIEDVQRRLVKTVSVLESAEIDYAVGGGNAVAEWVGSVDRGAVRFTRDVDIMIRRADLDHMITAMKDAGFEYLHVRDVDVFVDNLDCRPSEGVHVGDEATSPSAWCGCPRVCR